jgi:hypothetical protein
MDWTHRTQDRNKWRALVNAVMKLRYRKIKRFIIIIIIIIILTAGGLTPGGNITVQIYTQTVHRIQRTEYT